MRWIPAEHAIGVPHDVPVLGYRVNTCDRLRLWRADATESFDFHAFNIGDYYGAVEEKVASETLSKVLYPNDGTDAGPAAAAEAAALLCELLPAGHAPQPRKRGHCRCRSFPDHWAVQLNDTHPAIAVAELMRLLVDEQASGVGRRPGTSPAAAIAYTNHTLLPEALEKLGSGSVRQLLPRHLELIYEINRRFLQQVRLSIPAIEQILRRVSIIDEEGAQGGAHGPPGHGGRPPRQRGGGPAQRAGAERSLPGIRRALAREVHQRHQRRHARAAGWPWPTPTWPPCWMKRSATGWVDATWTSCASWSPWRRTAAFLERWAGHQAGGASEQLAHYIQQPHRACWWIRPPCSTCR